MIYHIGLAKQGKTMVIQARRSVDYLSCEIYDYMGQRITTKSRLKENRYKLLEHMKATKPRVYGNCKFAIVD